MRLRNRLLAILCILAFCGLGWLYFKNWVVQKPFAIILFVSDAMAPSTLAAARIYDRGVDSRLTVENLPFLALTTSSAEDLAIPDAGAAAAELARGREVPTGGTQLGRGPGLLKLARESGRAIGLVTTEAVGNPTHAAFLLANEAGPEAVAASLTPESMPDVFFAGGEGHFVPAAKGGTRSDNDDILLRLSRSGVRIVRTDADLRKLGNFRTARTLGLFANGALPLAKESGSLPREPSLSYMVLRAIQMLQDEPSGYLLVVDAGAAGRAAEANDGEGLLREAVALDQAVDTALKYAGEKSLVIVTGYRGIGGMTLNASPLRRETGLGILGRNAAGAPAITWATGPSSGDVESATDQPVAYRTPRALGYATDMMATGKGDGAEKLHGFLNSTAIFEIIKSRL